MRSVKPRTRRYKTHPLRGLVLLLAGVLLGAGALSYFRGDIPLPLNAFVKQPAQTHAPKEAVRAETTLTLPAQAWYALQLGAFDSLSDAEALAASFQGRGAAGYVLQSGKYLVLAAAYDTRADAQSVQAKLKSQRQVDTVVVEISRPEVTFRLSGNKENLDALRDALDVLGEAAGHLNALSLSLDRGEGSTEQAFAALRSEQGTMAALRDQLRLLFPKAEHPAVKEILSILDSLCLSMDRALNASGQSQLGARIKYCQLQCVCRLAAFSKAQAQE